MAPAAARKGQERTGRSTISGAEFRRTVGEREHEEVRITLAHYLPEGNEFTENGEAADAGTELTVKRHQARHLISAGYAAVDPTDQVAVEAALGLGPADASAAGEGGTGGSGGQQDG